MVTHTTPIGDLTRIITHGIIDTEMVIMEMVIMEMATMVTIGEVAM